ncbi:Mettl6 [Scenedesmus sp. PABB004]|nr:Mettl6 [Scenedesmus sp. PABB004]
MDSAAPPRTVHAAEAVAWLRSLPGALPCTSVVTSLPDVSELLELHGCVTPQALATWRAWFIAAARLVLQRCPDDGVAIFLQTDIKAGGAWIDKGFLVQLAAEQEPGVALLWHKLVCRVPPGTPTFSSPGFQHMLCFSRGVRLAPGACSPPSDVLPAAGEAAWARGTGVAAAAAAVRFVARATGSRVVLDPFCGHGTVLAVANACGLAAVGVELSPKRAARARALRAAVGPGGAVSLVRGGRGGAGRGQGRAAQAGRAEQPPEQPPEQEQQLPEQEQQPLPEQPGSPHELPPPLEQPQLLSAAAGGAQHQRRPSGAPAAPAVMDSAAPPRTVHAAEAVAWLRSLPGALPCTSVVTSLPDVSELLELQGCVTPQPHGRQPLPPGGRRVAAMRLYSQPAVPEDEVPPELAAQFEREAGRYWEAFYKRNADRFFRDRHYLDKEWPQLAEGELTVLEVGCGAGNTVFPLLDLNPRLAVLACDFSPSAVAIVRAHPAHDAAAAAGRLAAFVCDVTRDPLPRLLPPGTRVDFAVMVFVLSAVAPEAMPAALSNVASVLRPGTGRVLFRDYAAGDLAQARLDGHSGGARFISPGFYARGDGTCCYYYTQEGLAALFAAAGFVCEASLVHARVVENRKTRVRMPRRWVQAVFRYAPGEAAAAAAAPHANGGAHAAAGAAAQGGRAPAPAGAAQRQQELAQLERQRQRPDPGPEPPLAQQWHEVACAGRTWRVPGGGAGGGGACPAPAAALAAALDELLAGAAPLQLLGRRALLLPPWLALGGERRGRAALLLPAPAAPPAAAARGLGGAGGTGAGALAAAGAAAALLAAVAVWRGAARATAVMPGPAGGGAAYEAGFAAALAAAEPGIVCERVRLRRWAPGEPRQAARLAAECVGAPARPQLLVCTAGLLPPRDAGDEPACAAGAEGAGGVLAAAWGGGGGGGPDVLLLGGGGVGGGGAASDASIARPDNSKLALSQALPAAMANLLLARSGGAAALLGPRPARRAPARLAPPARFQPEERPDAEPSLDAGDAPPAAKAKVTFQLPKHVEWGEDVCLVGEADALGSWNVDACVPMAWNEGDVWTAEAELPAGARFEYKYIVRAGEAEVKEVRAWQPTDNLELCAPAAAGAVELTVRDGWEGGAHEVLPGTLPVPAPPAPAEVEDGEAAAAPAAEAAVAAAAPPAADAAVLKAEEIASATAAPALADAPAPAPAPAAPRGGNGRSRSRTVSRGAAAPRALDSEDEAIASKIKRAHTEAETPGWLKQKQVSKADAKRTVAAAAGAEPGAADVAALPTAQLKELCKARGLSVKGQRRELLARLAQHKA